MPRRPPKRTIVFTIELKSREFLPKCLLAYFCVKAGFRVFIGSFRAVHELSGHLQGALFFHKSTYKRRARAYKRRFAGHIAVLDEEMGIALKPDQLADIFRARFADLRRGCYDTLFVLNELHKDILGSAVDTGETKVIASGWPRLDLWRQEFLPLYQGKADEIKRRHGPFVLFASSFGVLSDSLLLRMTEKASSQSERLYLEETRDALARYLELLKWLDLNTNIPIIVRPHSGESEEEWRDALKGVKRIAIEKEGDVTPWIIASNCVITYRSTVSLQAALQGIPVVQYQISKREGLEDVSVYQVSKCLNSMHEVRKFLEDAPAMDRERIKRKAEAVFSKHYASRHDGFAAEKIAKDLADLHSIKSDYPLISPWRRRLSASWHCLKYIEHLLTRQVRRTLAKINGGYRLDRFEKMQGGLSAAEALEIYRVIESTVALQPTPIDVSEVLPNLVTLEERAPSCK